DPHFVIDPAVLVLLAAAFIAGAYGTLIGGGGGFLLVPFLLVTRPDLTPASITTISLGAVLFNGLSGALAYARLGRIDYRSGLIFAAATVPAAAVGALLVGSI